MQIEIMDVRHEPMSAYLKSTALSHSQLRLLGTKSPMHLWWYKNSDVDDSTESTTEGTIIHEMLLEHKLFIQPNRVITLPEGNQITTEWKQRFVNTYSKFVPDLDVKSKPNVLKAQLAERFPDSYIIDKDFYDRLETLKSKHDLKFLSVGDNELSVYYRHIRTGVEGRIRIDYYNPVTKHGIDLKTTEDAGQGFLNSIRKYGYDTSYALYKTVLHEALGLNTYEMMAVERSVPFGVCRYRWTDKAVQDKLEILEGWFDEYAEASVNNEWRGYAYQNDGVVTLDW